jgi:MFS family permease
MTTAHSSATFAANIPKYFAYAALKGLNFGLVTAIWVIFLQRQYGMNLTQVTLVDVAFWIAATLGELPTGIVADTVGRKASLAAGAALMGVSMLIWAFAPPVALIVVAYVLLAIGVTFLSGAEDALLYESLHMSGRANDYARVLGRVSATVMACVALGNLASGLLASVDLRLPFLVSGLILLSMMGIVLTFKEPQSHDRAAGPARPSYGAILRRSFALVRSRPALRYAMLYLALVPLTAVVLETVFLQPQAVALGVPLAGIGVVVMAVQLTNMLGATSAYRIQARVGEARFLRAAPVLIGLSLVVLAAFQSLPALASVAVIGFVTAALRPLVLNRLQQEAPDAIRATILSMQSLVFTLIVAVVEPLLGLVADQAGLPAAYLGLAAGLGILAAVLLWRSRPVFP